MTSGTSSPATSPLAAEPMLACSDEAMPRRSGTWSSTSSVTTGTIMAQPKANRPTMGKAQKALSGANRFRLMLATDTANMMTLDTPQTVLAVKTFSADPAFLQGANHAVAVAQTTAANTAGGNMVYAAGKGKGSGQ